MKLQCTFSLDTSCFIVGSCYDAERGNTGEVLIMQDELVSELSINDAWIAFEGIRFGDGSRFFDIESVARFREVM
ncbi:hypothetical protein [Escherichia phage vB_EcoS_011D2]|uniref:Uncharacterized protein n=1 Tax=Escherichia phage vB_EcoS_011D2 TaxID=2743843 RepID=A0A7D7JGL2_9CAUD|nr:hypothetical protein [Escherichia phage vB_EcoS_011D2]